MKVDLCMWAKNGAKFLPTVLKRIDYVIPQENVNKKVFVDDHSIDETVKIARSFNWETYKNKEGFVSGGAKEALRHVESEYFVSVEQDVFLAKNWWDKIPLYMDNSKVAIAQGIRISTHPLLRTIEEYAMDRFRHHPMRHKAFKVSLDNNIYRTKTILDIGGFPQQCPIAVDMNLHDMIRNHGYEWIIDESVISNHIKESILDYITHARKIRVLAKRHGEMNETSFKRIVRITLTSPARAARIVRKKGHPSLLVVYPILRLTTLRDYALRRKVKNRRKNITKEMRST